MTDNADNRSTDAWTRDLRTYVDERMRELEARLMRAAAAPDLAPADDVMLTTPALARRFNVTTRSIERWEADDELGFPRPIFVNRRKYWRLSQLQQWERARAAGKTIAA